jgi:muramoyltetrapeptide carboxypeptidase
MDPALVESTEKLLRDKGYEPIRGTHLLKRHGQFAGTDAERAADFQAALDDPSCRAILIMRGGYGSHRILDKINLDGFKKSPKWLVGFSDVTAIHGLFQKHDFPSLHAPMPSTYSVSTELAMKELFEVMEGKSPSWNLATDPRSIPGKAKGRLIGGNLSMISSIIFTPCFEVKKGDILILEDLDEMIYHVDRMMLQLSRSGILKQLGGLILGGFSDMRDNTKAHGFSMDNPYGMTAEEIILSYAKELGIPVMVNAPIGHIADNRPVILGQEVVLEVSEKSSSISSLQ